MTHGGYWLFVGTTWLLALGWFKQWMDWLRHFRSVPVLTLPIDGVLKLPPEDEGEDWQLTVVVPACNEQASIEATLRSLLASEGIRIQVIAVNDRSTEDRKSTRLNSSH